MKAKKKVRCYFGRHKWRKFDALHVRCTRCKTFGVNMALIEPKRMAVVFKRPFNITIDRNPSRIG